MPQNMTYGVEGEVTNGLLIVFAEEKDISIPYILKLSLPPVILRTACDSNDASEKCVRESETMRRKPHLRRVAAEVECSNKILSAMSAHRSSTS